MIVFGVGEVWGAPFMSKIINKTNNRIGVFYVMVVVALSSLFTVFVHSRQSYDVLWFLATFIWELTTL